jgi:hypothetical protein
MSIASTVFLAASSTTEGPLDPVSEKKKWLDRASEIPETRREAYKAEIEKIFSAAAQVLQTMPSKGSNNRVLAKNNEASIFRMQQAAKAMFSQYKQFNHAQLTCLERLDTLSETVKVMALAPASAIPTAKVEKGFMFAHRQQKLYQNMATASLLSKGLEAFEIPFKYLAEGVYKAGAKVCSQTGKRVLKEAASAISDVYYNSGAASKVKSFVNAHKRSSEKNAERLSEEFDVPLAATRQYIYNIDDILVAGAGAVVFSAAKPLFSATGKCMKFVAAAYNRSDSPFLHHRIHLSSRMGAFTTSSSAKPATAAAAKTATAATPKAAKRVNETVRSAIKFEMKLQKEKIAECTVNWIHNLSGQGIALKTLNKMKDIALSAGAEKLTLKAIIINKTLLNILQKRFEFIKLEAAYYYFNIPLAGFIPNRIGRYEVLSRFQSVHVDQGLMYTFKHVPLKSGQGGTAIALIGKILDATRSGRLTWTFLNDIRKKAANAGAQQLEIHFKLTESHQAFKDAINRILQIANYRYEYLGNEKGLYRFKIPLDGSKEAHAAFKQLKTKPYMEPIFEKI